MRVKRSFIKAVMFLVVFAAMISWSSFSVSAGTEDHKYVVVLDPGHGEKSFGTGEIYNGSYYREHDLVWKIAQYTKKELEKCPYIKVVMTKNSKEELPSLEERVKVAERNVADLLVSFHLNSFTNRNVNGACVLISQGNYRPYLAEQEKLFGSYVMDELMKLGIANYCKRTEGMYYRLASDGSKYINGKTRDYYAIVAGCVEADIPGVIIEHAFLSNYSDFSKFLSTEAKLKKIGVADAKAIKKYIDGLRKKGISNSEDLDSTLTGWVNKYGNCYYYKNGSPVKNKMIKIDGHYYYFDKEGIRYIRMAEI